MAVCKRLAELSNALYIGDLLVKKRFNHVFGSRVGANEDASHLLFQILNGFTSVSANNLSAWTFWESSVVTDACGAAVIHHARLVYDWTFGSRLVEFWVNRVADDSNVVVEACVSLADDIC